MNLPSRVLFCIFSVAAPFLSAQEDEEAARAEQEKAPSHSFHGNVGQPRVNLELPDHVVAPHGELTFFADFENVRPEGVPFFLVNRTTETVRFLSQDHDIFLKLEYEDENGRWVRAQNHRNSWCGNSYYPVSLGPGEHFAFLGYLSGEGKPARIRYRSYGSGGKRLISAVGSGRYHPDDVQAASVDDLATFGFSSSLLKPLITDYSPERWSAEKAITALELLSVYQENARVRREIVTKLSKNPDKGAEEKIDQILARKWPADADASGLLDACWKIVSNPASQSSSAQIVAWGVIADFTQPGKQLDAPEDILEFSAKALGLLSEVVDQGDPAVITSASRLLELKGLVNEILASEMLLSWVTSESHALSQRAAAVLSMRGEFESLAGIALQCAPALQARILREIIDSGGETTNGRKILRRSPGGKVEREFWQHCFTTRPVETVAAICYLVPTDHVPFNRIVHDPLHEYLEEEGDREQLGEGEERGGNAFGIAMVVEFLSRFRMNEDISVFESLLDHPAYQISWTSDRETKEVIEIRGYRVRREAQRALLQQSVSTPERIIYEERIPLGTKEYPR